MNVAEDFMRISADPDFVCVAQFIGTFGVLLGIPPISLDTLEDGLESNKSKSYLDAYSDGLFTF